MICSGIKGLLKKPPGGGFLSFPFVLSEWAAPSLIILSDSWIVSSPPSVLKTPREEETALPRAVALVQHSQAPNSRTHPRFLETKYLPQFTHRNQSTRLVIKPEGPEVRKSSDTPVLSAVKQRQSKTGLASFLGSAERRVLAQ